MRRSLAIVCGLLLTALAGAGRGNEPDGGPELPANELGQVLVLMYHGIARPEGEWQRTPEAFAADLQALYEHGYRPIALRDFALGRIDTAAGRSPVVLTFDDGRRNHLELIEGPGGVAADPNSAVGLLQAFSATHPDFPLEATFFLSGARPFGDAETAEQKVRYLLAAGLDIGNHTDAHANLALPAYGSRQAVQRTIGAQAQRLEAMAQGGYTVDTYALCHGARPRSRALWPFLVAGAHRGHAYRHVAVLNVGGPAAPSPFDERFNPAALPRVRGSDHTTAPRGLHYWLERFDKAPGLRFVSDGDPETVTVPAEAAKRVSKERLSGRRLIVR